MNDPSTRCPCAIQSCYLHNRVHFADYYRNQSPLKDIFSHHSSHAFNKVFRLKIVLLSTKLLSRIKDAILDLQAQRILGGRRQNYGEGEATLPKRGIGLGSDCFPLPRGKI